MPRRPKEIHNIDAAEQERFDEIGQESFEDISAVTPFQFSESVIWSTDWTAETILSQLKKGNIQLDPKFQRRDAWSSDRKSRFIESLILNLPVPQIILAERKDQKGSYIVIDGKQRLLSIRQFCAESGDYFNSLKFGKLDILTELNNADYNTIKTTPEFKKYLLAFENQPIRTVIIKSWPAENYLYTVFLRLNTGSLQLSPQELRQALHPGKFIDFATDISETKFLQSALKIDKPDRRMRDIEIVVRFFAFKNFINTYSGKLKDFLDDSCKKLNEGWSTLEGDLTEQKVQLEEAIKFTKDVFQDDAFSVWYRDSFTGRFNRPVFDIMTYYFSDPVLRKACRNKKNILKRRFVNLCRKDNEFLGSLLTSTKDKEATFKRFTEWGEILKSVAKKDMPLPSAD